ncbi:hypothetical protein CQW23_06890 [Capsicum baccatum]|uniref:Ubiquitin-like protease family profile domain-containing protein n=1 Tax=Capsicum baccatum TaxID=33114 RepID=A0A2G2X4L8_CAPBA|nr:hypothetical protein CQW23_06890 [Capsicum baccatum]
MELFGATAIIRKIILEGRLVIVDDSSRSGSGSGSGSAVGANDAPLTIFEIISHYDYDHTSCIDFSTFSECSACKCQDCKAKHDGVINAINALTASVKEMASKRGVIPSKRISYLFTPLEIKAAKRRKKDTSKASSSIEKSKITTHLSLSYTDVQCTRATEEQHEPKKVHIDWSTIEAYRDKIGNPFDVQYVEGISQQTIGILNCGPFVATYAEYLSDELQVLDDGLDAGLLRKIYATLLWKYGEAKGRKPYASDTKDPRRPKPNFILPDEEQLVHTN